MANNKNEVFEYLIDALRHQVNNNPYKQQCEDLAHEVSSLKNQLRDASTLVAELQETIKLMNEDFGRVREGGVKVTGAKGECPHLWHYYDDHLVHCALCGLKRSDEDTKECEHDWQVKTYPWSDETYEYCPLCREVRQ